MSAPASASQNAGAQTPSRALAPEQAKEDRALFDCQLLLQRRLEAGLSRRAAADGSGVSQTTVRLLEQGKNHQVLTLGVMQRYCQSLGIDLPSIFSRTQDAGEPGSDDRRLEAALAERAPAPAHRDDIQDALGWKPSRFRDAMAALEGDSRAPDCWSPTSLGDNMPFAPEPAS